MPSVSVHSCSALLSCFFRIIKKSNNVGVERGVATRRAQMVGPMMTVTVTNFEGFNYEKCGIWVIFRHFCKIFSKLLPSEALNLSQ